METGFQDFNLTFHNLNIPPKIVHVLDHLGFQHPSFIQAKTIPLAIDGKDIVGVAQTGTGKTLAFGIPMLACLTHNQGRGLILAPTRELAQQIHEAFKKIGQPLGIHSACLIGGEDIRKQIKEMQSDIRVIIATPGRMLDHLRQQTTRLDDAIIVVLDEADRMLDMGFIPQVEMIFKYVAQQRQTMLFSATMPEAIVRIAQQYMNHPVHIEITPPATAAKNIEQSLYIVSHANKFNLLQKFLHEHKVSTLIFCRTKIGAARLAKNLKLKHFKTAEIHSDKTQEQRQNALEAFKKNHVRILVATDIAARGIDVKDIGLVVNYDLPDDADNYVHRIGRTGRAGSTGLAIAFACPDQMDNVKAIEESIQTRIKILEHADMPKEAFSTSRASFRPKPRPGQAHPHQKHSSHSTQKRGSHSSTSRRHR